MTTLTSQRIDGSGHMWATALAERVAVAGNPAAGFVLALITAFTVLAAVLHGRRIYLRP